MRTNPYYAVGKSLKPAIFPRLGNFCALTREIFFHSMVAESAILFRNEKSLLNKSAGGIRVTNKTINTVFFARFYQVRGY